MYLKLRVIFTILAAICLAAIIPIGTFWDFTPAIICAAAGGVFFLLMLLCKSKQEKQENPPEKTSTADFFHPETKNESANSDKTE